MKKLIITLILTALFFGCGASINNNEKTDYETSASGYCLVNFYGMPKSINGKITLEETPFKLVEYLDSAGVFGDWLHIEYLSIQESNAKNIPVKYTKYERKKRLITKFIKEVEERISEVEQNTEYYNYLLYHKKILYAQLRNLK
jgi:hypothetical protein